MLPKSTEALNPQYRYKKVHAVFKHIQMICRTEKEAHHLTQMLRKHLYMNSLLHIVATCGSFFSSVRECLASKLMKQSATTHIKLKYTQNKSSHSIQCTNCTPLGHMPCAHAHYYKTYNRMANFTGYPAGNAILDRHTVCVAKIRQFQSLVTYLSL